MSARALRSPAKRPTAVRVTTGSATAAVDGCCWSTRAVHIQKAAIKEFGRFRPEHEHSGVGRESLRVSQAVECHPNRGATQVSKGIRLPHHPLAGKTKRRGAKLRQPAIHLVRNEPVNRARIDARRGRSSQCGAQELKAMRADVLELVIEMRHAAITDSWRA